jgi:RNA polymerase sigma-70 factor (ECF subfamily)
MLVAVNATTGQHPAFIMMLVDESGDWKNLDSEERELVIQARQDPDAFARLYDLNYSRVFNYLLYTTGDVETALDLTSETFLKALRAMPRYSPSGAPFSAWLLKIASNEAKMLFRKRKRRTEIEYMDETVEVRNHVLQEEVARAADQVAACEEFVVLSPLLRDLSSKYREVIFMRFYECMSIGEIAELLGRSPGTVKSQLHRGLKALERAMQPGPAVVHLKDNGTTELAEETD